MALKKRVWSGLLMVSTAALAAMPTDATGAATVVPGPRVITDPGFTNVQVPAGVKHMVVTAWGAGGGGGGGAGGQGGGGG
ncbi:hypothetical protein ACSNOD_13750, partial [Streptomyces sp. URMC 123]